MNAALTVFMIIRPDVAFHDLTGNAPLAGEKKDDGLAGLGSFVLSRSVVVSPNDAVGGDIEAIPSVGERDNQGYTRTIMHNQRNLHRSGRDAGLVDGGDWDFASFMELRETILGFRVYRVDFRW